MNSVKRGSGRTAALIVHTIIAVRGRVRRKEIAGRKMEKGITAINEKVKQESAFIQSLRSEIGKIIVGQKYLVDRLLVGLLANGHVHLEGVPGLAKTMSVRTLSSAIATKFQRIQFTPDLLPADLIGTLVYNPRDGTFTTKKDPSLPTSSWLMR